jgi:threonine dehydratase
MSDHSMRALGWKCATCAAVVDIKAPLPFRCPNATAEDPRHVLQIVRAAGAVVGRGAEQTFVNYDSELAWAAYAGANGMDNAARDALVDELDGAVREVGGVGFERTPFGRSEMLSDALGFDADGGVWIKDETGGVGGSQKARFLFSILLHLRAAEEIGHLNERPRLAIASCGNAALAAATMAKAAQWPLDVFVPTWMSDGFGDVLDELGAVVHRCERRPDDPQGDPAMLRFRDAVAAGAIPFTVQGPENALCLDGGRTVGWEICAQMADTGISSLDSVFVQVGGGAFAAALSSGIAQACGRVPLYAVQTEGCAPFSRAWERAQALGLTVEQAASRWQELMTIWDHPTSLADGILDDETYDWIGVFAAVESSGGAPVVAPETLVVEAHQLAVRAGFDASATGTAGLAGLLRARSEIVSSERVCVVMSGVTR